MATEDIGLADSRAQPMTLEAWDICESLGSPEGELALAQVVLYTASIAKSNAGDLAFYAADVPSHLRNAPTKRMKSTGYGKGYQYDPDTEGGAALDQTAFPVAMGERVYYQSQPRGLEAKLNEKLDALRQARRRAQSGHE